MQSVFADRAPSRCVRSNITKVKDQHVRGSAKDGESKADQHVEIIEWHIGLGPIAWHWGRSSTRMNIAMPAYHSECGENLHDAALPTGTWHSSWSEENAIYALAATHHATSSPCRSAIPTVARVPALNWR